MDEILKLQKLLRAKTDEARALLYDEKGERRAEVSEEDKANADALIKECRGIKAEIAKLEADEARLKVLDDFNAQLNAPAPNAAAAPMQPAAEPPAGQPATQTAVVTAPAYARHGPLEAFTWDGGVEAAHRSGRWLQGVLFRHEPALQWCRDNGIETRALGEDVNTAGGYLSPDEMLRAIINLREERGVFRREALVQGMSGETLSVPRRTGGVTFYAVGENPSSAPTESNPTFDQVLLVAKQWAALTRVSKQLSEDSAISIADFLASEFAYAAADKEDDAGFNGDGSSTYHGIHGATVKVNDGNHAGSIHTAITGNTAFGTLDLVDFEAVVGKLPQYAENNAKWFISKPGFAASMARLMDAAGGNTIDILAGGVRGKQFLGYPVVISQRLNTTLTAQTATIVCLFGDLRQAATLGDRIGFGIQTLTERYAELLQIGVLGTFRSDIVVHELGDGTDAGSIIALKTPAS